MIKTEIVGSGSTGSASMAHTPFGPILYTTSPEKQLSFFNAVTRTTAGTSVVVQPVSGNAVALTDLIVSGEKKDALLTVRFTDGTNTITVILVPLTDSALVFGMPFAGRWMGWRNARLEFVTSLDFTATVAAGYFNVPAESTLSFAEWDAAR